MREILADIERWQEQGEEVALATLVRVQGSAPRLPGARLCLTRSGKVKGSVTGGCVESEVFEQAMQVLDHGRPMMASYGIEDESGFQVGLSCGGSIDVLIEPLPRDEAWQAAVRALRNERPVSLAIGLEPDALLGLKLTVLEDGTVVGSIDPGLDGQVIAEAGRVACQGGARVLSLPTGGGEGSVFIEAFAPLLRLFVVGATHTAACLCRMAKEIGFRVTVIDARTTFATAERFPDADELLQAWPDEALDEKALDSSSFVVVLTHDPKFDIPALKKALRAGVCYIGLIGSTVTQKRRREQLLEEGFREAELACIRGPIGLDIGARTPEEMALSILAEMLAVRYGRRGGPLRERRAPINADS